LIVYGDDYVTG